MSLQWPVTYPSGCSEQESGNGNLISPSQIARQWIHIHSQDLIIHSLNTETFLQEKTWSGHTCTLNNQQPAVVLKDEEESSCVSHLGSLPCSAVGQESEWRHVNTVSRLLHHFLEVFLISCCDLISPVKALKQRWCCNCNQLEHWSTRVLCF